MRITVALAVAFLGVLSLANASESDAAITRYDLNIPRQSLDTALKEFAAQTGLQIARFSDTIDGGAIVGPLTGQHSAETALKSLLTPQGLTYKIVNERTIAVVNPKDAQALPTAGASSSPQRGEEGALREGEGKGTSGLFLIARAEGEEKGIQKMAEGSSEAGTPESELKEQPEEIVVTGTHIRGGAAAGSQVLVLDEQAILRSGYSSTEQLIQSLPQNTRSGAEGATADAQLSTGSLAGLNSTFGSGINLRGLGSGATLVLLNGHRIGASSSGTFTDISLIPINAIQRIEILTDGASAIYGADAVAGVVNIILKGKYEGAETKARYGFTAPSGRDEVRFSQTLGGNWSGGSALLVADYLKQTELSVNEREFTDDVFVPTSIYPANEQLSAVISASHRFNDRWSLSADAQYADVERFTIWNTDGTTIVQNPVALDRTDAALRLTFSPTGSWDISLEGLFSREDIDFSQLYFIDSSVPDGDLSSIQNQTLEQWGGALKASGTLFVLPAGEAALAIGIEHRSEDYLHLQAPLPGDDPFIFSEAKRDVDSAFAEIRVPVFGAKGSRNGSGGLELSLAARYDDYSDFGDTTNPKFGLSWVPLEQLEIHTTYSTSFRAPPTGRILSDSQRGTAPIVLLRSFATPDGSATVPGAVLLGSTDLQPEESENWTAGFTYRPQAVEGLQVSLTYYDISYTDRIVTPTFSLAALSTPGLQTFISNYDTSTDLQSAIEQLVGFTPFYLDLTGGAFGPDPLSQTTFTFDSRKTNAESVDTNGLDFVVDYASDWHAGTLTLGFNANYIAEIDTIFAPGAPTFDIVDTTGNPVGLRLRTTAGYARNGWDGAIAINYTDQYTDNSGLSEAEVDAYTTVDLNVAYTVQTSSDKLENLLLQLSVTNLFDESPPFVQSAGLGSHYDSANADPLGRLISLEIAARW